MMKWLGNALVAIVAFFGLGGLVPIMLQNWLRNAGYLEHPEAGFSQLLAWITDPKNSVWITPLSIVLVAAPAAYALWRAGQSWNDAHKKKLEELGHDMLRMAAQIRNRQGGFRNPWPGNFADRRGKLEAVLTRAGRFWIKTPSNKVFESDDGLTSLLEYLDVVGAHLSHGNFRKVRPRAKELSM
jgi:hypothetical protein